jgi:hypothetical protein
VDPAVDDRDPSTGKTARGAQDHALRPRSTKEIHSPSATVQMFPGRPNIDTLLGIEMENQVGTLGVSVCGPGALSDDVRSAVRNRQYQGAIDFVEESFSW